LNFEQTHYILKTEFIKILQGYNLFSVFYCNFLCKNQSRYIIEVKVSENETHVPSSTLTEALWFLQEENLELKRFSIPIKSSDKMWWSGRQPWLAIDHLRWKTENKLKVKFSFSLFLTKAKDKMYSGPRAMWTQPWIKKKTYSAKCNLL